MNELFELIELIENIFNRPFGILLIIAGLSFLLIAVLFKLNDIHNRIANMTTVTIGSFLIITGAVMYLKPLTPPSSELQIEKPQPASDVQPAEAEEALRTLSDKTSPENRLKTVAEPVAEPAAETVAEPVAEPAEKVCLHYASTARFEFIWNTGKNRTDQIAAFYKPLPPAGYKILGHYAQGDNNKPLGRAIAVKVSPIFDGKGIMAYPVRYERIWYDAKRTERNGAIWRPIPPIGYRCMGDVATPDHKKPDRKEVVCLKESLVTEGKPGDMIWNNRGSNEIRVCPVMAKDPLEGFVLNLFQGYGRKWSRRTGYASLPVLKNEYIAPAQK